MDFGDQLSIVLEERPRTQNPLDAASGILHSMDSLKQQLIDLQNKLGVIKQRMGADLALSVRRNHPGLNVAVDQNGCKVGYRSKNLCFDPDVEKGVWVVSSSDDGFLGRFKRQYDRNTVLSPEIGELVSAITDYFAGHFKSLGEDIVGVGVVLIEGKRSTLGELTGYGEFQPTKKLNTRLARRLG
jgi:hypothetical protein